jgi:hypothetical protein
MDFIPLDTLGQIIMKARKFDAGVAPEELEEASNATDDGGVAILEDTPDNPTQQELVAALRSLNDDQVAELLALVWLGRGDFDKDTWSEALAEAQVTRNERAVRYLVGTPLLGDLIEEGLAQLGRPLPEW